MTPAMLAAVYIIAFGALGALAQALSPNSTWLPWSPPGPVRAIALLTLTIGQTALESTQHGMAIGLALLTAFGTSSLAWFLLLIQCIGWVAAKKAAKATVVTLFLGATAGSQMGCSWFHVKGPLGPGDLPSSLICVEFLVGSPAVVDAAVCAGTPDELVLLENRYLAEHPKTVGVRSVK